jgi:hypothetical protein
MRLLLTVLLLLPLLGNAAIYSPSGSDGTPTVNTCGTASFSVTGTDQAGVITLGTVAVTACTLAFSTTLPAAPACVVSSNSSTSFAFITSTSTSIMVLGLSVSLPGGKVNYFCPIR